MPQMKKTTVAEQRKYAILDVQAAKRVAGVWLEQIALEHDVDFGLPEVDDRYHIWRVPLVSKASQERLGEVVIDAYTTLIVENKSTAVGVLETRLLGRNGDAKKPRQARSNGSYQLSNLRNTNIYSEQ